MTIFTCRPQQSFLIGDDVSITVLKVKRNRVHFGIKSPHHLPVRREEIYKKIQQQKEPRV